VLVSTGSHVDISRPPCFLLLKREQERSELRILRDVLELFDKLGWWNEIVEDLK
jgi:hypothetical protein